MCRAICDTHGFRRYLLRDVLTARLSANTHLYARLSLRDTRLFVYITASVIVLSPICMVFVPGVLFLLKQKLTR